MFGTYRTDEVTLLLKNISGQVQPLGTEERERRIQSGVHYSEMLPLEYEPSPAYLHAFHDALHRYAPMTASAVASVAEQIWEHRGADVVLVSLARAGISIGVLLKRYLREYHQADVPHYALSIIRGRGIDRTAMAYLLERYRPEQLQFVDGWTGKGAIFRQLQEAMQAYPGVSPGLAVLSDPAVLAEFCGTHDDFLIASACLNATVSGLLSRTFYRPDIIAPGEFHGAAFYDNLLEQDLTETFLTAVAQYFPQTHPTIPVPPKTKRTAAEEVAEICRRFHIADVNLVKPSIGEATRVLLRRMPWKVLVHRLDDEEHLGHLYQLAREKGVELVEYPLENYRACGLIRSMGDT